MHLEYAHLLRLVAMLEANGSVVCEGGFRPNQGGVECRMTQPIDFSVVATFTADDLPPSRRWDEILDRLRAITTTDGYVEAPQAEEAVAAAAITAATART